MNSSLTALALVALLGATNAANASKFRIQTASGVKAIQQLP